MMRTIQSTIVALGLALAVLATPGTAQAQGVPLIGVLRGSNTLVRFDSTNPSSIVSTVVITGLPAGDVVRGIDFRPANGLLYALVTPNSLTTQVQLYTINAVTGAATAVGPAVNVLTAGNFWGMTFNAVVDRVRIVNDFGANARLNPNNGALAGNDTTLTGGGSAAIDSVAYDNQVVGATTTTLFALHQGSSTLSLIGSPSGVPTSPNSGAITPIGPLGVTLIGTATALDFAPDGTLFAAFGSQGAGYSLYTVNTVTGAATAIGLIGGGAPLDSLAVANAGLAISPGSGTFTSQQRFDVAMLLNAPGRSVVGGSAIFDGFNATPYVASCVVVGHTATGLTTLRCPNFGGPLFGPGTHQFSVTLVLDNGSSVAASVTWLVVPSTEP
jgi:hypothetical protein